MGMSTYVKGFRPPDEKFKKMEAAYKTCKAAGIPMPMEIEDFFDGAEPDPNGVEIDLTIGTDAAAKKWNDGCSQGYDVDVSKLPKDVTVIRFINSW